MPTSTIKIAIAPTGIAMPYPATTPETNAPMVANIGHEESPARPAYRGSKDGYGTSVEHRSRSERIDVRDHVDDDGTVGL